MNQGQMAVVKGHYEVRRKMAEELKRLRKRVAELEAENKKLKEDK